ncbi:MAG: translation initiation factor IF-2, partial [Chlorobiaceae bacterium]|nr:translation initiation factor IF-2 [Chlorobiaceae bacterium]
MAVEDTEKKYRISDIARELQVSPQEVLLFVKQEGGKVASTSSMVLEEIRNMIFGHFSDEKKMVDETKKIRAEKQLRLTRLEEQSRKTYEKEKQLSEHLAPAAPPVTIVHESKKEHVVPVPVEIAAEAASLFVKPDTEALITVEAELPEEMPAEEVLPEPEVKQEKEEPTQNEQLLSYDMPKNIGGLTVLGTLDMQAGRNLDADRQRKNRKKNFKEQADALKDEFEPKGTAEERSDDKLAVKKKPAKVLVEEKAKVIVDEGAGVKKKKGKKKKKPEVDDKVISANIRSTISGMDETGGTGSRQKFRRLRRMDRERELEEAEAYREAQERVIRVTEYASPHELAELMGITAREIIQKCFSLGKFVTINQRLDKESIELIALEFGFDAEFVSEVEATAVSVEADEDEDMKTR